jgi:hypothetical protein
MYNSCTHIFDTQLCKEDQMSEYQYVAFRAINAPVSKKDLAYMRRQSTRAEITPWSFANEYQFGDFHGNAIEMMRRGSVRSCGTSGAKA